MRAKRLLWLLVLPILLLSGCIRTIYDEPTSAPQVVDAPTATPIVVFDDTPTPAPTSQFPPSVYFEPSVLDLTMGQTANINVWIDDVRDLNSIALELGYNPAQIQIDDSVADVDGIQIAPGEIPEPSEVNHNEVTDGENGRIIYAAAQAATTGASGSGVVASIELHGIAGGLSPLSIESVTGFDHQGNEIEIVPLSNGLINVIMGDAPPTSQPATQPTEPAATPPPTTESTGTTEPAPTTAPTSAPVAPSTGGIYYVVQSGENLFRIGLKFGSTAQAIAAASNISDPNQVHAGHLVLIPVSPPQGAYGYYVQPRDTVYSIARRFGMTVEQLVTLNSIGSDYHIGVGQILTVTP